MVSSSDANLKLRHSIWIKREEKMFKLAPNLNLFFWNGSSISIVSFILYCPWLSAYSHRITELSTWEDLENLHGTHVPTQGTLQNYRFLGLSFKDCNTIDQEWSPKSAFLKNDSGQKCWCLIFILQIMKQTPRKIKQLAQVSVKVKNNKEVGYWFWNAVFSFRAFSTAS